MTVVAFKIATEGFKTSAQTQHHVMRLEFMLHSKCDEHVRQWSRTKGESLKKMKECHLIYYRVLCKNVQLRLIFSPIAHEKMQLRSIVCSGVKYYNEPVHALFDKLPRIKLIMRYKQCRKRESTHPACSLVKKNV